MTEKTQTKEKERNSLLNELWDKLSREERLYSTLDELKQKEKEYLSDISISNGKDIKSNQENQEKNMQTRDEIKKDNWTNDESFKKAMNYVLRVEGGYSNNKMTWAEKRITELHKIHLIHIIESIIFRRKILKILPKMKL